MEIPCSDEIFMVTFELIAMNSVPPGIVKNNNSLEFSIKGYENLKEEVFYTWLTFLDKYHPTSGSSDQTQPLGKWRVGPKFRFFYLYNILQPRVQVHVSCDSHQWDTVPSMLWIRDEDWCTPFGFVNIFPFINKFVYCLV